MKKSRVFIFLLLTAVTVLLAFAYYHKGIDITQSHIPTLIGPYLLKIQPTVQFNGQEAPNESNVNEQNESNVNEPNESNVTEPNESSVNEPNESSVNEPNEDNVNSIAQEYKVQENANSQRSTRLSAFVSQGDSQEAQHELNNDSSTHKWDNTDNKQKDYHDINPHYKEQDKALTAQKHKWTNGDNEGNTKLFSAYLYEKNKEHPTVVLLGLHNHTIPEKQFYCVFQYHNKTNDLCSKHSATQIYINTRATKEIWGIHLSCPIPDHNQLPTHVSVFQDGAVCASPNSEWIRISKSKSDDTVKFGVCIETPLFGSKLSMSSLIEGIERNLALGAEWITVYIQDDQPDRKKVLESYKKKGVLEIVEWKLSEKFVQNAHYYGESVAVNDCLYRNMLRAKYLVFTDIDEIIVPQKHTNWRDMMTAIDKDDINGAYIFGHSSCMGGKEKISWEHYLEKWTCNRRKINNYPLPIYIQHNYCTPTYPYADNVKRVFRQKTIVKPALFATVGVHTPLRISKSGNITIEVPPEVGLLNHYRIPPLCHKCKNFLQLNERLSNLDPELFTRIRNKICELSNNMV